jgi:hypothetical protein
MLKTILRAAAVLVSFVAPAVTSAFADDTKLIDGVAPEVAEVATGGSWSADKQGGFYRAIVLMTGDKKSFGAHVYLQWLAFTDSSSPIPAIVKTVPIKEINDQGLANASIALEGEEGKDNEVTVVVSSYDLEEDKDITLFVKAGQPGTYAMAAAPAKGADDGAPARKETPGKED